MQPFPQELLNQQFRHKYLQLLLEIRGSKAIIENEYEPCSLPKVLTWKEVLENRDVNRFAPIIFECALPAVTLESGRPAGKISNLFLFQKRKSK